ncbi:MAG: MerR family transcriptional regulator [Solirubrobacteraceae bacterium]|jgi:excisionase family DNA binding protein
MYAEHRLNVRETAARLGVHENTVRNWEEKGLLRAVKLPGSGYRRFDAAEVERMRDEMLTNLAPAVEGPVIHPKRPGRIVAEDGD